MIVFTSGTFPGKGSRAPTSITSTGFANSYGLVGEWTAGPGLAFLESYVGEGCLVSRLAVGAIGLAQDDPRVVPAVKGVTVWPDDLRAGAVTSYPNRVGVMEPTTLLDTCPSLGVVVYPDLAGDITLPKATSVLTVMLDSGAISLRRGNANVLEGDAAMFANRTAEEREAAAERTRRQARVLAKHVTQIASVTVDNVPSTGRLVVTSPADPVILLAEMERLQVAGGAPVGLTEYPGGIVVDCGRADTDDDLKAYAAALAVALVRSRRIDE